MYTLEQIYELRLLTKVYKLKHNEVLDKYTDEQLQQIYNGIGPDCFPEWLRDAISDLNWDLKAVALIHDVEWYEHQIKLFRGEAAAVVDALKVFHETNSTFSENGRSVAWQKYAWYNPLLYRTMAKAVWFGFLCGTARGFESFNRAVAPMV